MKAHTPTGPDRSERYFWWFAATVVLSVICAPLVQRLLGLPAFSWPVRIRTSIIVLVTVLPFGWLAFRFGRRVGLLIIAAAFLLFALWARFYG
jgi:hypothetical protein